MLQSSTLPESWRVLLDGFRPAFRRSRTFGLFVLLATGLVTQSKRRTVVGMLAATGMAAAVSFHACCRFFSHHGWDTDRIGLILARLIVSRLLAAGAAIEVVVDDTLFRRWGPKVHAAYWTHDGSAQDPNALGRGNRWIILGIVVTVPFSCHPVCLPILLRAVAGQGHRLPGAAGSRTDFDSGPNVPGPPRARRRDAAYHGMIAGRGDHAHYPTARQRRPLRARTATHRQTGPAGSRGNSCWTWPRSPRPRPAARHHHPIRPRRDRRDRRHPQHLVRRVRQHRRPHRVGP